MSPISGVTAPVPWEGLLRGRTRVRVSPQEAGRPDLKAVWRAEGGAQVSAMVSGSVGPSVLAWVAFKGRRGHGGPCKFSHSE